MGKILLQGYVDLRRKVEEALLVGQREVEQAKVFTYWKTGDLICKHLLNHKNHENYGRQMIDKLSEDLNIESSTLWRCVQFVQAFPILGARRESLPAHLTWTHYRQLITIPNLKDRMTFLKRAQQANWSYRELKNKIQIEFRSKNNQLVSNKANPAPGEKRNFSKLIPKCGTLYNYKIGESEMLSAEKKNQNIWIDLGFEVEYVPAQGLKRFKLGEIVESEKTDQGYNIRKSQHKENSLYTFKAKVLRVVDGDTLLVRIDLGFGICTRQYLRLRGINCAEIDSSAGLLAKKFVEQSLLKTNYIILNSTRDDKYGRYLADVFYGSDKKYLNQNLLNAGHAVRMFY